MVFRHGIGKLDRRKSNGGELGVIRRVEGYSVSDIFSTNPHLSRLVTANGLAMLHEGQPSPGNHCLQARNQRWYRTPPPDEQCLKTRNTLTNLECLFDKVFRSYVGDLIGATEILTCARIALLILPQAKIPALSALIIPARQ